MIIMGVKMVANKHDFDHLRIYCPHIKLTFEFLFISTLLARLLFRKSVGYIDREQQFGLGPETYRLYNGLSVDENSVLGAYRVRIFEEFIEVATPFTLTFRVAGEIVRVDEDVFPVDGNIIESLPFVIDDYVSFEGC